MGAWSTLPPPHSQCWRSSIRPQVLSAEHGLVGKLQTRKETLLPPGEHMTHRGGSPRATWFYPAILTPSAAHTPTRHAPRLCLPQSCQVDAITPATGLRKLRHKVSGRGRIRTPVRASLQILVLRVTCARVPHILFLVLIQEGLTTLDGHVGLQSQGWLRCS